ncbi:MULTISPECIES: Na(+)-translocating NADH-quinone reductase subunit C [Salegentibacter]|jgi:Na+-transporting NADH:ubiquinone oxidoreductase subunit C|uniref:Na(+)-translocating NADH-quinone reductase subunit C n=1 Tax=Salegentibacter agarivorans TaxID=345907 RepID=A0A1I2LD41_9FLAO|nr:MULTISPECIES: Na(+)-translocating NADH-quinone reductase subunit C [Salegentibacter]APS37371.1 NADH-quinone reductase [Salegentibacter sp. T436]MBO2542804.1 Na(+)-translocating NADH-quinone reductase subunit C [Salegentibacter sp. BDJ18]SFF76369.1 Na+-transporting NADH:ubiquinone oxidoreductase subunit C [Salegentibacter agarivorans]|tara:strand:- start:832 stop:1575 length:744 start_codon:yes stop_codon:yes gene_type:complete
MEEKSVNKTNSNGYTFLFAVIMVIVVASVLAFTATSLQPIQRENVRQEKMQSILATIGVETDRAGAEELYNRYITEAVTLDYQGEEREDVDAFTVDLAKEIKREDEEQNFPLYIAEYEGEKYYIVPLRGNGLWNAIFGYISLKDDVNTIKGATFDHLGETPGLGAEITKEWFKESFAEEKIFDGSGNLVGVSVVKGDIDPSDKEDNQVDAISGATITGDGVSDMISERLQRYLPYFKKQTDIKVATK